MLTFEEHIELGRKFGYPECCIQEFAYGCGKQAVERGVIYIGPTRMYVPCIQCMGKPGWFPYEPSYRLFNGFRVLYQGQEYTIEDDQYGVYFLHGKKDPVFDGENMTFVWSGQEGKR